MQMRIIKSKVVKPALIALAVLLALGLAVPQLLTIHAQSQTGGAIDAFILQHASEYQGTFSCLVAALADLPQVSAPKLLQAIARLERAARMTPNNAHTHLLLGRAYCLQQNYPQAVAALSVYQQKRPDNPLGLMETSFAYFSWAQTLSEVEAELKATYMDRSILALEAAGIGGDLLSHHADVAYLNLNYEIAWVWYELAGTFRPLTDKPAFRNQVLDGAFRQKTPAFDSSLIADEAVLTLDESLTIQPSAFFRLEDGTPVRVRKEAGMAFGMYFRNTDPGGVFIDVKRDGVYCIIINALDRPPAPTIIELSVDLEPIMLMQLPDGDDFWHIFEKKMFLDEGLHLLGLRLTNDENISGGNRNGHVGEILLKSSQD